MRQCRCFALVLAAVVAGAARGEALAEDGRPVGVEAQQAIVRYYEPPARLRLGEAGEPSWRGRDTWVERGYRRQWDDRRRWRGAERWYGPPRAYGHWRDDGHVRDRYGYVPRRYAGAWGWHATPWGWRRTWRTDRPATPYGYGYVYGRSAYAWRD